MAEFTALIDALKGLWWPLAAVIIAVVYKAEIRSLLPRLRKAGPTGVEFDPADAQKASAADVATATEPGKLKEFPGIIRTPAIERVERQLHTALANVNVKAEEKPDLLVRLLAQAQLEATFERTYNVIFGSQILLLRRLNERGRVTIDEAREFFRAFENNLLISIRIMVSMDGSDF